MRTRLRIGAFVGGCAAFAIAVLSPLEPLADRSFAAHMIQHELLMAVAAPLLIVSHVGLELLRRLPRSARRNVGRLLASDPWRRTWRFWSRPLHAWGIHAVMIWAWHMPALFQLALERDAVHALEHFCFLGSALLFWWAMFHPRRRAALGGSILYLFTTAVHTAVLGALLATSRSIWYPVYVNSVSPFGLTPLEDQQLAGLVMWIPAGMVYLVAALAITRRWLGSSVILRSVATKDLASR